MDDPFLVGGLERVSNLSRDLQALVNPTRTLGDAIATRCRFYARSFYRREAPMRSAPRRDAVVQMLQARQSLRQSPRFGTRGG